MKNKRDMIPNRFHSANSSNEITLCLEINLPRKKSDNNEKRVEKRLSQRIMLVKVYIWG